MKKAALITLIVLTVSFIQAKDYMWWNEPGPAPSEEANPAGGELKTKGDVKALIIVSRFPEDPVQFLPFLFYDSLIADSIEKVDDSFYLWSATNYFYNASWGQLRLTGDVNPGMGGQYAVAPHSLQYYWDAYPTSATRMIRLYERELLEAVDTYIDFSDYDANNDGCVDFVIFIHPLCPNSGFGLTEGCEPDSTNAGYYESDNVGDIYSTDDGVDVFRVTRLGSALSYYHDNEDKRIDRAKASNLICHEMGHSFGAGLTGYLKYFTTGEFRHSLPDRYESSGGGNHYAYSAGIGKYSVMQMGYYTMHPQPYTPWERMALGWIEPTEITENSQNMIVSDFNGNTGERLYLIPVDSIYVDSSSWQIDYRKMWLREYFLVSNYQPSTHWLDDLGQTFIDELDDGPADSAHGLLVWHVNERFWDDTWQITEFAKFEDIECAEGLFDLSGTRPSPMGTEAGWDRLDRWSKTNDTGWTRDWNTEYTIGNTCHYTDFFNPDYKNAFHTLTNPSSDGYNCDPRAYSGPPKYDWGNLGLLYRYYNDSSWGGPTTDEQLVLQNLPTHVALEGIEYNGGTDIKLCIRRSRIWIDQPAAMDRTTQRKFICDTTDTFHFIYPLRGNIYYTRTYAPDTIWYKAEKVGPQPVLYDSIGYGIWPALTLDEEREPLAVFYDTSCSEVIYSYREESLRTYDIDSGRRLDSIMDTVWHSPPCTLDLAGDPGPVAIDYGFGDGVVVNPGATPVMLAVGGEGTVHLAYLTRVGNHDELHYAYFPKYHPEDLTVDRLENNLAIDNNRNMGVSIEVDILNDKICIAYGCYKDTLGRGDTLPAIYYRERVDTFGWTPAYPFDPSPTSPTISRTPGEPLVPFIDPDDGYLRIVFNANDKILFNRALVRSDTMNIWDTFIVVIQDTNQNRYPQIGGNMVTWTKVVGADSNVYACKIPRFNEFKLSIYPEENWFCHVTKADTSAACLYQQGTFLGPEPRWAVYYRGPCGFGGNQESDGNGQRLIPEVPEFSMSVSRNILRGNQFSVFTTGECELAAYDVTGRRIAKLIIEAQPLGGEVETPIDCKNWASGIYFLRAVHEGENATVIRTEKVVLLR